MQSPDDLVDITDWKYEIDFEVYPVGSREKSLMVCPQIAPHKFLIGGHRYLFKKSRNTYPGQFWAEIIAYKVGCFMGIKIPPAFVAIDKKDSNQNESAALMEWFYDFPGSGESFYEEGADIMDRLIDNYDHKTGRQHNFQDIINWAKRLAILFEMEDPTLHWAKVFALDTIIGNTDRHQANWGLLFYFSSDIETIFKVEFAPAFDNGTSLGFERLEEHLYKFNDEAYMERYINRGYHHIRWQRNDQKQCGHFELIKLFIEKYPKTKDIIFQCLNFEMEDLCKEIKALGKFQTEISLTKDRIQFIINLITIRRAKLLKILES